MKNKKIRKFKIKNRFFDIVFVKYLLVILFLTSILSYILLGELSVKLAPIYKLIGEIFGGDTSMLKWLYIFFLSAFVVIIIFFVIETIIYFKEINKKTENESSKNVNFEE